MISSFAILTKGPNGKKGRLRARSTIFSYNVVAILRDGKGAADNAQRGEWRLESKSTSALTLLIALSDA